MHMIFVRSYFQKLHLITLLDFKTYIPELHVYLFIKHRTTVFRRKNKMIEQHCNIMTLVDILTHPPSLAASGGEFDPQRLKTFTPKLASYTLHALTRKSSSIKRYLITSTNTQNMRAFSLHAPDDMRFYCSLLRRNKIVLHDTSIREDTLGSGIRLMN